MLHFKRTPSEGDKGKIIISRCFNSDTRRQEAIQSQEDMKFSIYSTFLENGKCASAYDISDKTLLIVREWEF